MEDLSVATILMMVGGKLALLKPRKVCPKHVQPLETLLMASIVWRSRSEV